MILPDHAYRYAFCDRNLPQNRPGCHRCRAYRHRGHFEGDPCAYRDDAEVEEWKEKDPIPRLERKLLEIVNQSELEKIQEALQKDLAAAEQFAEESPYPDVSELTTNVYT